MRLSEAINGTMNHWMRNIPKRVKLLVVFVLLSGLNSLRAQGFDPGLANQLQAKIDSIRVANNVKGMSVCIIHPKQGLWTGVSGISKPGTPISDKMIFGIGSNTKLFTGVQGCMGSTTSNLVRVVFLLTVQKLLYRKDLLIGLVFF